MAKYNVRRYVRYTAGNDTSYGTLEGDDTVLQLEGDLFNNPRPTGKSYKLSEVTLGVPLDEAKVHKVFGVAGAYNNPEQPPRHSPHPRWFTKLPTCLNAHGADVDLPAHATNFNFEGELVLIIGKEGKHISLEDAPSYIFGVTVGNDWSENTWFPERQRTEEPSRFLSKSMDTWACLYHTIYTGLDYSDLQIEIRLNGEPVARGRTSSMTNSPAYLVHYVSHFITLQPGDVIYTGTVAPPSFPGTRRQMQDGDVVDVEIENIGTLSNRVVAMKQRGSSFNLPRPQPATT
jgi:2-keto-4-pentenoate hydratase/2-oxohepta-3-ene-1,7-dioic acid hydratase in catechol pathway